MARSKTKVSLNISEDVLDQAILAMANQKPMPVRESVRFIMEHTLKLLNGEVK